MRAVVLLPALVSIGCAASRAQVVGDADRLVGPVSLTSQVPGPRGEILRLDVDLEEVGRLSATRTFRAIAWGLLPPWRTWDVSDECNAAMRRFGGEAITKFYVSTEGFSGAGSLWATLAAILPILPTSITVKISGIVVRRVPPGVTPWRPTPSIRQ